MTLSRGGGHDGEFKSRLEMGQGEVKMLAFWGAWKAKTTDVARGEESRPHSGSAGSSPRSCGAFELAGSRPQPRPKTPAAWTRTPWERPLSPSPPKTTTDLTLCATAVPAKSRWPHIPGAPPSALQPSGQPLAPLTAELPRLRARTAPAHARGAAAL